MIVRFVRRRGFPQIRTRLGEFCAIAAQQFISHDALLLLPERCRSSLGFFDMIHHRVRFPNDVPLVLDLEYYYIHAANTARFRRTWNLASPSGAFGLNCSPSPLGQVQCASNHHHASKEELGVVRESGKGGGLPSATKLH